MCFRGVAAPIAAQRPWPQVARLPFQRPPAADTGGTHPEARGSRAVAETFIPHSGNDPLPQVQRKRL